jgi:putative tryptophan/tyrosine transport system substrate-binding protein
MRRRDFIKAATASAVAWPVLARAQQPAKPVLGFVNVASAKNFARPLSAFLEGLGEPGYVDGRNVIIEYRWAEGANDQLPSLVADLIQRKVSVIAATSTPAAIVAKAATATIPIVFTTADDPVRLGLVASLNRPGGNLTGATQATVEVAPKQLQLLHELIPAARVMALLVNPASHSLADSNTKVLQSAARSLGLDLHVLNASTEREFDGAFAKCTQLRAGGLVIGSDPFFTSRTEQLAALAVRHAVPAVYHWREFALAGGLVSYGAAVTDVYRLAGNYTGRILKGDKPADLPVQQVTKVEMHINQKTAKALGINVPQALLSRADEVIE